jgi:predicted transcriptional regulator
MSSKCHLTTVELELMNILWSIGKGTVRDVMAELPKNRDLAYTSVSTMLRILEQKKIVTAVKSGRQHIYQPRLSKQNFANHSIDKIVTQIFSGKSTELVACLVDNNTLSLDEINEIQALLHAKKKELSK